MDWKDNRPLSGFNDKRLTPDEKWMLCAYRRMTQPDRKTIRNLLADCQ